MSYIIKLGFTPCPNDTFIFEAILNRKIDTEGIEFICDIHDIEELNRQALSDELDMSKVSFHAFLHLAPKYRLLDSGCALGNNCGPLLIASKNLTDEDVENADIAIPGKYTTAALLLNYAYPKAKKLHEFRFSNIEQKILKGAVDAGVIIHESRFTYQAKGLTLVKDLGAYWEQTTGFPIPLGGIVIKRDMPEELISKLQRIMRSSVEYAMKNPESSRNFVMEHAAEMDEDVIQQHITLYVNEYTLSLGENGRKAVNFLFEYAFENKIIDQFPENIFV